MPDKFISHNINVKKLRNYFFVLVLITFALVYLGREKISSLFIFNKQPTQNTYISTPTLASTLTPIASNDHSFGPSITGVNLTPVEATAPVTIEDHTQDGLILPTVQGGNPVLVSEMSAENRPEISQVMLNIQKAIVHSEPMNPGTTVFIFDSETGYNMGLYKAIEDMLYYVSIGKGDELIVTEPIPPIFLTASKVDSDYKFDLPKLNLTEEALRKFEQTSIVFVVQGVPYTQPTKVINSIDPYFITYGVQKASFLNGGAIFANEFVSKIGPVVLGVGGTELDDFQSQIDELNPEEEGNSFYLAKLGNEAKNINLPDNPFLFFIVFDNDPSSSNYISIKQSQNYTPKYSFGEENVLVQKYLFSKLVFTQITTLVSSEFWGE